MLGECSVSSDSLMKNLKNSNLLYQENKKVPQISAISFKRGELEILCQKSIEFEELKTKKAVYLD